MVKIMQIVTIYRTLILYRINNRSQTTFNISKFTTSTRRVAGASKKNPKHSIVHSTCELDSHDDTIVAGNNCIILHYTGVECDVSPYRSDYESITNVPIVTAATAWQSPITGQTFIIVLNEALWMGE